MNIKELSVCANPHLDEEQGIVREPFIVMFATIRSDSVPTLGIQTVK
jgi:hypothetical protein